MVLIVDTSVWIRFLTGREPYATELDSLLERDEVVGHELVFGELLVGDKGAWGEGKRGRESFRRVSDDRGNAASIQGQVVVQC